ncbi:MAG: diiron oxygenase, partial [Sandaracinaceae bacterium]
ADPGLVALAARAVDDEHRHAALCEELAGRYAGRVVGPHASLPHQRPVHREAASPELRAALFVVGQCALNETFASAYLDAARREAKTPLARAALRALLEDEVDHARIGWAYLSTLTPALRAALSDWLVPLVVCNLREWRRLELPDGDALAAHGVPPKEVAVEALDAAARDLLVPAFRHVGLDTRALERWVTASLPT